MTRILSILLCLDCFTAVLCAQTTLPTWPQRAANSRSSAGPAVATQPLQWTPQLGHTSAQPDAPPTIPENLHAPSSRVPACPLPVPGRDFHTTTDPLRSMPLSRLHGVHQTAYQPPRFNQTNAGILNPAPSKLTELPARTNDRHLPGLGWSTRRVWGPATSSPIQLAIEPEPDSNIQQTSSAHWDDGPQNMSLDPDAFISKDLCNTDCDCLQGTDLCGDPMNVFRPTRAALSWLYGDGDHFGMTHWAMRHSLDIPEFNFLVTPGTDIRFIDGPRSPDLPSRLYTAFVDFNYEQEYDPNWTYQIGLRPMVATDADHADQSALRLASRFVLFRRLFERMELVAGVYYYDREDVPLLPTLGLIYRPDDNTRWHLVFPNPRLSQRFMQTDNFDLWMYQAFEFGGGTWAIERATGFDDTVSYRDWRWLTGVELSAVNGRRYFVEVGLVFRRKVEYRSFGGDYKPSNTGMLRAGMVW